jgi:hypothetical protein
MSDKKDNAVVDKTAVDTEKIAFQANSTSGSGSASLRSGENNADDEGYGSTPDHIFSDPSTAEYWRGVYEKAGYENRHRFDPTFTWTAQEERKLVRKIDLRIMLW